MRYRLFFNGTEITDNVLGYKVNVSDDEDRIVYHLDLPGGGFLKYSGAAMSVYDNSRGEIRLYLGNTTKGK